MHKTDNAYFHHNAEFDFSELSFFTRGHWLCPANASFISLQINNILLGVVSEPYRYCVIDTAASGNCTVFNGG